MYDDDFQSTTTSTDSLPFIHSPNDSTGSLPPVEQSEDSAPIQKTIKFGSRITVNYPVKIYQKKRNFDPRSHITAKDLFVLKDPSIKDAEENFKKNNNYLIDDATLDILYPNCDRLDPTWKETKTGKEEEINGNNNNKISEEREEKDSEEKFDITEVKQILYDEEADELYQTSYGTIYKAKLLDENGKLLELYSIDLKTGKKIPYEFAVKVQKIDNTALTRDEQRLSLKEQKKLTNVKKEKYNKTLEALIREARLNSIMENNDVGIQIDEEIKKDRNETVVYSLTRYYPGQPLYITDPEDNTIKFSKQLESMSFEERITLLWKIAGLLNSLHYETLRKKFFSIKKGKTIEEFFFVILNNLKGESFIVDNHGDVHLIDYSLSELIAAEEDDGDSIDYKKEIEYVHASQGCAIAPEQFNKKNFTGEEPFVSVKSDLYILLAFMLVILNAKNAFREISKIQQQILDPKEAEKANDRTDELFSMEMSTENFCEGLKTKSYPLNIKDYILKFRRLVDQKDPNQREINKDSFLLFLGTIKNYFESYSREPIDTNHDFYGAKLALMSTGIWYQYNKLVAQINAEQSGKIEKQETEVNAIPDLQHFKFESHPSTCHLINKLYNQGSLTLEIVKIFIPIPDSSGNINNSVTILLEKNPNYAELIILLLKNQLFQKFPMLHEFLNSINTLTNETMSHYVHLIQILVDYEISENISITNNMLKQFSWTENILSNYITITETLLEKGLGSVLIKINSFLTAYSKNNKLKANFKDEFIAQYLTLIGLLIKNNISERALDSVKQYLKNDPTLIKELLEKFSIIDEQHVGDCDLILKLIPHVNFLKKHPKFLNIIVQSTKSNTDINIDLMIAGITAQEEKEQAHKKKPETLKYHEHDFKINSHSDNYAQIIVKLSEKKLLDDSNIKLVQTNDKFRNNVLFAEDFNIGYLFSLANIDEEGAGTVRFNIMESNQSYNQYFNQHQQAYLDTLTKKQRLDLLKLIYKQKSALISKYSLTLFKKIVEGLVRQNLAFNSLLDYKQKKAALIEQKDEIENQINATTQNSLRRIKLEKKLKTTEYTSFWSRVCLKLGLEIGTKTTVKYKAVNLITETLINGDLKTFFKPDNSSLRLALKNSELGKTARESMQFLESMRKDMCSSFS